MLIFRGRGFGDAGMRVARVGASGSRVPGFPGQGRWARWLGLGQRGERPEPGQDLGEQLPCSSSRKPRLTIALGAASRWPVPVACWYSAGPGLDRPASLPGR